MLLVSQLGTSWGWNIIVVSVGCCVCGLEGGDAGAVGVGVSALVYSLTTQGM